MNSLTVTMCDVCIQSKHKQKLIRTNVKRATAPFELMNSDAEAMDYTIKQFTCNNERREYDVQLFRMLLAGSGTSFEPCPPNAYHKNGERGAACSGIEIKDHTHTHTNKNGVAKRIIATTRARALLIDSHAPVHFLGEAVLTAVFLHRRTPNSGLTNCDDRDDDKAQYETPTKCYKHKGSLQSSVPGGGA